MNGYLYGLKILFSVLNNRKDLIDLDTLDILTSENSTAVGVEFMKLIQTKVTTAIVH